MKNNVKRKYKIYYNCSYSSRLFVIKIHNGGWFIQSEITVKK